MAFDGYGLCDSLPARPAENASYPVSVRQAAVLLRTSFRRPLAAAESIERPGQLGRQDPRQERAAGGRLRRLEAYGIITTQPDPSDGRKLIYALTAKGIDLAPVLTEMVLWAARHEETENQALVKQMQKDKQQFLAAIRQRWAEKIP